MDEFEKEKIVYLELVNRASFCFDDKNHFALNTTYMITGKNLKYLISVLNSKLNEWYFDLICAESGVGTNRWIKQYVKQLPIPIIPKEQQKPFITLVDSIINSKEKITKYKKHFESLNAVDKIEIKEEIEKLESLVKESTDKIDSLVYELYGLNSEEVCIVEGVK